jgi:hypothetical protein
MVKQMNRGDYRRMRRDQGLLRLELFVREGDVELVREVAKHLKADDPAAEKLRAAMNLVVPHKPRPTFQEWMATADEEDAA